MPYLNNIPELLKALSGVPRPLKSDDRSVKHFVDLLDDGLTAAAPPDTGMGTHVFDAVTGVTPAASGVSKNVTSISLAPGEWDVFGNAFVVGGTVSHFQGSASIVSATLNAAIQFYFQQAAAAISKLQFAIPGIRLTAPGPGNLTVYLVANISYTVAPSSMGGHIGATKMG